MDFKRHSKVIKEVDSLATMYPHVLLLYKTPPMGEISLTEFEDLAYERVQVLRILEQATQMGHKMYSTEWRNAILGYLRKQNLRKYIRLLESTGCSTADAGTQIRREDYISHFILRLAYCRSLDLRNWFIARELEMFKMRFLNLSSSGIKKFMVANKLDYIPISAEEKETIKSGLLQSTIGNSPVQIENSDFYKVPFGEVLDLVRNRSVYIEKGFAFIPTSELISCVITQFREHLQKSLMLASKKLPSLSDERIIGLLSFLHSSYTGKDYSTVATDSGINASNIHLFVPKSFPLCMRYIYDIIKTSHHMKHFGRLQFGLFLKGIGLNLEEAIKYWRTEFCKLIDEETFNKKYLYNIRHSYGTIGKMTNYTPYGCKKVILSEPGPGEHHGCPFKLWDNEMLKQKILEYGLSMDAAREVVDTANKGHYQVACSKYFAFIHNGIEPKQVINHPNQYFEESVIISAPKDIQISNKRKFSRDDTFSNTQNNLQNTPSISTNQSFNKSEIDDSIFDDGFDLSGVMEETMEMQ